MASPFSATAGEQPARNLGAGRGHIENGKVKHYQITIKAGFTLDDTK